MKKLIGCLLIGLQLGLLAPAGYGTGAAAPAIPDLPKGNPLAGDFLSGGYETTPEGADLFSYQEKPHMIDLKRWGISSNGTKPVQTTQGINKALQWAAKSKITAVTLPPGTYLIDKNSRINMVGNMLFQLSDDTILKKQENGKEHYELMFIGYGANNVTLRGGTYLGDKDSHDYSKKDNPHTPGTHERGYGITVLGANNITIEGVKGTHFTGDGLIIGAHETLVRDLYQNDFVSGGFDYKGKPAADKTRIRTVKPLRFDHPIFKAEKQFELTNPIHLGKEFDLFFFDAKNKLVKVMASVKVRELVSLPEGAAYAHVVFRQASAKDAYIEFWNRKVTENIVIRESEFAYNRRQGITVGGADRVLIVNNKLHNIKGIAPQSGIDAEGGYGENGNRNSRLHIKDNVFNNNASYDVILYDGKEAVVEGNHLGSKGAIGLAISQPFTGALVINNHFDGTRIVAAHDAIFLNNKLNDSSTTFDGPRIAIDGMTVTNGTFSISAKTPFGVTARNISIYSKDKRKEAGLALWGKPVVISDIYVEGESALRTVTGRLDPGSVVNRLKVVGYNSLSGLALPQATYNDCYFEGAKGSADGAIALNLAGKYVFDRCTFQTSETARTGLFGNNAELDLTVKNSLFRLEGNTTAISVQAAAKLDLQQNVFEANAITQEGVELIKLGDYWKRNDRFSVKQAVISGNEMIANAEVVGISTQYAGSGAPPYIIENNELEGAVLALKSNDKSKGNLEEAIGGEKKEDEKASQSS